jgi:5-methylcytosine-specific restriction endonuclease McrA
LGITGKGDFLMADSKICARCKQTKPVDSFARDKNRKDGLWPYCRQCCSEYKKARYAQDKESQAERRWAYREANRQREADRARRWYQENHERARIRAKEWRSNNKEHESVKKRAWYEKNKTEVKDRVRRNRLANPELDRAHTEKKRARKRNAPGSFTPADIQGILRTQNSLCAYCGRNIADCYTVDHIIPLARGGSNWPSNLQLLCRSCNASKGARTHDEYLKYLMATRDHL